jgi:hypothetical protein
LRPLLTDEFDKEIVQLRIPVVVGNGVVGRVCSGEGLQFEDGGELGTQHLKRVHDFGLCLFPHDMSGAFVLVVVLVGKERFPAEGQAGTELIGCGRRVVWARALAW